MDCCNITTTSETTVKHLQQISINLSTMYIRQAAYNSKKTGNLREFVISGEPRETQGI